MAKPLLEHGSLMLLPRSMKRLHLTPIEVVNAVTEHQFLFIGGPHKAGTTILWECLRKHSKISGFIGATDSDYSEGIFLQTVYPRFGLVSIDTFIVPREQPTEF